MIIKSENIVTIGRRKLVELTETGYIYNEKNHLKIALNRNENTDKEPQFSINNNVKIILNSEDIAEAEKQPIHKFGYEVIIVKNRKDSKKPRKSKDNK